MWILGACCGEKEVCLGMWVCSRPSWQVSELGAAARPAKSLVRSQSNDGENDDALALKPLAGYQITVSCRLPS